MTDSDSARNLGSDGVFFPRVIWLESNPFQAVLDFSLVFLVFDVIFGIMDEIFWFLTLFIRILDDLFWIVSELFGFDFLNSFFVGFVSFGVWGFPFFDLGSGSRVSGSLPDSDSA